MQNSLYPFVWRQIELSQTVQVNNVPHPTRYAIGEWLEYADPQNAVDVILGRNPHIKAWGIPVMLTGMEGARDYETVVYHPVGFLLIVMESAQPKAKEMKQAVAEFVWNFAGPRTMSFKERTELMKLSRALYNDLAKTKDAFVRDGLLAHLRNVALALGDPVPDVLRLGKDANQLALSGV